MSAEQRRITLTEEGEWWVATDESVGEHGVTSQGRTRQEALENLDEAVTLFKGEIGRPPTDEELREWGIDPEDNRRRREGEGEGELPDVLK